MNNERDKGRNLFFGVHDVHFYRYEMEFQILLIPVKYIQGLNLLRYINNIQCLDLFRYMNNVHGMKTSDS